MRDPARAGRTGHRPPAAVARRRAGRRRARDAGRLRPPPDRGLPPSRPRGGDGPIAASCWCSSRTLHARRDLLDEFARVLLMPTRWSLPRFIRRARRRSPVPTARRCAARSLARWSSPCCSSRSTGCRRRAGDARRRRRADDGVPASIGAAAHTCQPRFLPRRRAHDVATLPRDDPRARSAASAVMGGVRPDAKCRWTPGPQRCYEALVRGRGRVRGGRHPPALVAGCDLGRQARWTACSASCTATTVAARTGVLRAASSGVRRTTRVPACSTRLSMDKIRTKAGVALARLPTPACTSSAATTVVAAAQAQAAGDREGVRGFERMSRAASSDADLPEADRARGYLRVLLVEQLIQDEATPSACSATGAPSIRIVPAGEYYDYHANVAGHAIRLPGRDRRDRAELASLALARIRRGRLRRLGSRRLHARPASRPAVAARGQHRARHDQPLAGAEGGGCHGIEFDELVWRVLGPVLPATGDALNVRRHHWKPATAARSRNSRSDAARAAIELAAGRRRPSGRRRSSPRCCCWSSLDRPVRRIRARGHSSGSPPEIERRSRARCTPAAGLGGPRGRATPSRHPGSTAASVSARWPRGLRWSREVAAARWGGRAAERPRRTCSYATPATSAGLPLLEGRMAARPNAQRLYLESQGRHARGRAAPRRVRLDARGAWEIEVANGVSVRLGRQDVEARLIASCASPGRWSPSGSPRSTTWTCVTRTASSVGWKARGGARRGTAGGGDPDG